MAVHSVFSKYFETSDRVSHRGGSVTFIGADAVLKGDTLLQGAALIAGTVLGTLSSSDHIKIELGGMVEADVYCKELKVCGTVKGIIRCDKLVIVSSGLVEGEVFCNQMEIYNGGQFIGTRSPSVSPSSESLLVAQDMTQTLEAAVMGKHECNTQLTKRNIPELAD